MNCRRLLIVDDDTALRNILADWVQILYPQYEIFKAGNGSEALVQFSLHKTERPFYLVLTDYQMPVMDGLDLARTVRQSWPEVRIVLMTGHNLALLQREAYALRLDGLLEKPINLSQLEGLLPQRDEI